MWEGEDGGWKKGGRGEGGEGGGEGDWGDGINPTVSILRGWIGWKRGGRVEVEERRCGGGSGGVCYKS